MSGVTWTGSCAAFALAGSALALGSDEWREFALKVAPRIDRLNLTAAAILLLTGALNLAIVSAARNYSLSATFVTVLSAKIGLFLAMTVALTASWRAETRIRSGDASGMAWAIRLSGLTAVAGGVALGLGLWLTGS